MRSIMGSEARLRNMTTRCRAPACSKLRRKKSAVSFLTPMAAKMMAKSPSSPATLAWRTIWAASSLCFMPEPEKMGSFWPRMRVAVPSMAEIPV